MEKLLKVEEFAVQTGLSKQAAYAVLRAGGIPHIRINTRIRIPESALARWIEEQLRKNAGTQEQAESLATDACS